MYVLQLSVQAARCTVLSYNLAAGSFDKAENGKTVHTVKTLNIGTPRPATVVVLNLKQFNFTMK